MTNSLSNSSDITPMVLFPTQEEEMGYSGMNSEAKKVFTIFFKSVKNQVELNSNDSHKALAELLCNMQNWMNQETIDAPFFQITAKQIYTFLDNPRQSIRMVGRLSSRCENIIDLLQPANVIN